MLGILRKGLAGPLLHPSMLLGLHALEDVLLLCLEALVVPLPL